MNPELLPAASAPGGPSWARALRRAEDALTVLALAVMVALPSAEIVARKFFGATVPASSAWVQHLVLMVGMLGGALAARDNRLLSLSTLTTFFPPRAKSGAQIFANAVAATVAIGLCLASVDVVLESQRRGRILALGIPVWVIQLVLVLGFGAIALRLLWHGGTTWRRRLLALALAAALLALLRWLPVDPAHLRLPALVILLAAAVCGLPVFSILGGAALVFFWSGGDPISTIPNKHYTLTVNPTLPSIPLFTLAGYFLAEGGAAKRFVALFRALFGGMRGGPAIITVLVCAFFTSFTGASGVTILALGGLLMPILLSSGYSERTSLGLLAGAGSLGLLFPPCLPPILYSIVASSGGAASIRMEEIFQGGLVPGLLLMGMTMAWGIWKGSKQAASEHRFDARLAWQAIWTAKWELLIPVVALVALFGGFATPVEAAAITALYAFVVETFIYRDLRLFQDVPRVMTEAGLLIGGVLLILGVALGFTHFLIVAQIPDKGVEWVTATIESKWLFLLALNLVLLLVGCLMDVYSAIVVVVPLLIPVANAFGIDPIHLGIIFLANLELGYLTPPVGMNLFLASYRFNKPVPEVARASLPMLAVLAVGVLLITYIPALTTWLPAQLK